MKIEKLLSLISALLVPLLALAGDSVPGLPGGSLPASQPASQPASTPAPPPTTKGLWERAEAYRETGRYKEALADYQGVYLVDPSPLLLLDIAGCYRAQGFFLEAKKLYKQYLYEELDSPFQDAVIKRLSWLRAAKRGKVELNQREDEETAIQVYQEADTAFQEEYYLTATRSYATAYLLKPSPLLLFNLAQAYRFAGDSTFAKKYHRIFLKKIPSEPLDPALLEAGEIARGYLADQAARFPEISLNNKKSSRLAARTRLFVKQLKQDRRWLWVAAGAVGVGAAIVGVAALPARADVEFEIP